VTGLIPEKVLEEIRNHTDIVEVISDYVMLKKAGKSYKGLCPFHGEKDPSFVVSEEKQLFHCFGCGVGGNVFTFLMKYENMSFVEAARSLGRRYGIEIPELRETSGDKEIGKLAEVNALALNFYVRYLRDSRNGQRARDYLTDREIGKAIWDEYRLGYAPRRWDAMVNHLKREGVNLTDAERIGLLIPRDGRWYDRFRDRVIFPICDLQDRVIAFGGRVLKDTDEPKYLNSPESLLYKKGNNLYGLNVARKHIRSEGGRLYVVEGYFDLLSMSQRGVKNVVATLGTAFTRQQVRVLRRFGRECFLLFDPDRAGKKAAVSAVQMFMQEDTIPTVVPLPSGLDPDEYCRKGLPLEALWQRAMSGVDYALQVLMEPYDLTQDEGKRKAIGDVLPFLLQMRDGVSRGLYFKRLAELTGVPESAVLDAAGKMRMSRMKGPGEETIPRIHLSAEKKLLQMMIQSPDFIPLVSKEGVVNCIENKDLRRIGELVVNDFHAHGELSLDRLCSELKDRGLDEVAVRLAFADEEVETEEKARIVADCIRRIKITVLQRKKEELNRKVREAEAKGDEAMLQSLLLGMEGLKKQMQELKNEGSRASALVH